jgi:hypothetical protein
MAEKNASMATSAPVETILELCVISRMAHPYDGDIDLSTTTGIELINKALES